MSVDKSTVMRISQLARIEVAEGDQDKLADELNNILTWVEQLNEVDTEGVAPMSSGLPGAVLPQREDLVSAGNRQPNILRNAPDSRSGFFVVPKVIE
ncbi:MAG: Asp-tRNA(Asn)/Glu-tRNA(Gln) amidotransferase subunit GatC [Alphaproteobacteria bacterium]